MHASWCLWRRARAQMEGMVTDLQLAREKQVQFEDWMSSRNKSPPVDISVTVRVRVRASNILCRACAPP